MPAALTYPGVYVEEIPSGVRTITGVSTSVAAFVDYFKRGLASKPVRVFNFGDFEREFGGLDTLSEASYGIDQFFRNGGAEAWVIRAVGAPSTAAGASLLDGIAGGTSLVLEAGRSTYSNPGAWGKQLRVQIDPLASNRYNLTVLLIELVNGRESVVTSERFLNLSNGAADSRNVRTVINDEATGSKLVRVTADPGANRPLATGTLSGNLSTFPTLTSTAPQINVTIGTEGTGTAQLSEVPTDLNGTRRVLESAIRGAKPESRAFSDATVTIVENRLRVLAGPTVANSQITFSAGGTDPAASDLGLLAGEQLSGRMSGDLASYAAPAGDMNVNVTIGTVGPIPITLTAANMADLNAARTELESKVRAGDASTEFTQARALVYSDGTQHLILLAGTAGAAVALTGSSPTLLLDAADSTAVLAHVSTALTAAPNINNGARLGVQIGTDGPHEATFAAAANSLTTAATQLQAAIRAAAPGALFTAAQVAPYDFGGDARLISMASGTDAVTFSASPADSSTVDELLLTAATGATNNVQSYAFGVGAAITGTAHGGGTDGVDAVPDATALRGDLNTKTGMFALEEVDLFNLLCVPRAATLVGDTDAAIVASGQALLSAALTYCEKRRAFLLVDTPAGRDDPEEITQWLDANGSLRNRNAALFYPRVKIPDPLDEYRLRSFGASGTVAGLFARIDSTRGVWKAPAGTEAVVRNVSALEDILTDQENGVLNPLAINCLRNFPIFGNVVWGSRTLEGADQQASEWKYIPVRRMALFLEESLYRGLKWVVFEPNDEPLWAQIRLNVGAFMQNLFRQGAFQGTTPREAYFVKCDRETTTQNDINLGIVNILVGFAPLKPAEFVVIKLKQIAGQIAT